jgi:hypothetical protein
MAASPLIAGSPPLHAEVISRVFKDPTPFLFSFIHFSIFFFSETDIKEQDMQKELHIWIVDIPEREKKGTERILEEIIEEIKLVKFDERQE